MANIYLFIKYTQQDLKFFYTIKILIMSSKVPLCYAFNSLTCFNIYILAMQIKLIKFYSLNLHPCI